MSLSTNPHNRLDVTEDNFYYAFIFYSLARSVFCVFCCFRFGLISPVNVSFIQSRYAWEKRKRRRRRGHKIGFSADLDPI